MILVKWKVDCSSWTTWLAWYSAVLLWNNDQILSKILTFLLQTHLSSPNSVRYECFHWVQSITSVSLSQLPGTWFNIVMPSYQYRKSHCGAKTILWLSCLHNGISYTGKTASIIRAQAAFNIVFKMTLQHAALYFWWKVSICSLKKG